MQKLGRPQQIRSINFLCHAIIQRVFQYLCLKTCYLTFCKLKKADLHLSVANGFVKTKIYDNEMILILIL